MARLFLLASLIGGCFTDPRIDNNQPFAAQTRLAAEAAQSAALKAAAASSAAAAHAAAFRKDPDLAKYQQYLDILRAHYGIQLPMHPNVAAQQSNPSVPRVQTYPVASMVTRPSPSPSTYSKYSTTPTASNYYPQQGGVTQSYYQYATQQQTAPPQSYEQPSYPYAQPAPVSYPDQAQQLQLQQQQLQQQQQQAQQQVQQQQQQQQQHAAAAAAYASYANQAAAYGTQQPVNQPAPPPSSYSSYGQYGQQTAQPAQPTEYSYPSTQQPTAPPANSAYSSYSNQYSQQPQSGYQGGQYGQQEYSGYGQEYQQQQQQQQAAVAATQPPQSGSYASPSGGSATRPDPRVVIAYPPAISGKPNPQQPDSSVVAPSQSSYPQEYLPRQPAPVQKPIETPRPRPADPRDYGYPQQVQQPMEQTRVDGAMTGSPMEWWERVSSAIAHEISSVTTTPKYIVPIIPATTISPRPAPSPIPMQPMENHGYTPSIPSSPLVPINPVEPPRMISQQPPIIYTGAGTDSFPTPGDLPTPSFTPPPIPHTTAPTPSPTTPPPPPLPTQSIVHPSSIQTPHASVSATAPSVPQPKSIKPTTKEGKAAATSREALAEQIRSLPAVLYTRSSTSKRVEKILRSKGLPLVALYIDKVEGREGQIEKHLEHLTGSSTMPYLFICGTYIGSEEHVEEYDKKGQMEQLVEYVCKGSKETKKKNKKDKRKKNE